MEIIEINKISDKLKNISNDKFEEIYEYIHLIDKGNSSFELTEAQKKVLDIRRKTNSNIFIPKAEFIERIQKKYGV